jgi:hypothetical protein
MSKPKIRDQLKSLESYINDIPAVMDPCKMCDIYKKNNNNYDWDHVDEHGDHVEGKCKNCCWFYPSNFKTGGEE